MRGTVGTAEIHGIFSEGAVDLVDGGVQPVARFFLRGAEEVGRVGLAAEQLEQHHADFERGAPVQFLGAFGPELVERVGEGEGVLRFVEGELAAPVGLVAILEREVQHAGVESGIAQPHGGLLQEAVEHGERGGIVAQLGREHVAVADGLVAFLLEKGDIFAVEQPPHLLAPDTVPDATELGHAGGVKLRHGVDAMLVKPALEVGADAGDFAGRKVKQFPGEIRIVEEDEPVGLLHIGGHLGEEPVGSEADRTAQAGADLALDFIFDLAGESQGAFGLGPAAFQLAGDLVDRLHLGHMHAGFDHLDEPAVVADVGLGPRLDHLKLRNEPAGLGHAQVAGEAHLLGLDAHGDAAGGLGQHRHDADRLAAEFRPLLLLDRSEEGIEVDGQSAEGHRRKVGDGGDGVKKKDGGFGRRAGTKRGQIYFPND